MMNLMKNYNFVSREIDNVPVFKMKESNLFYIKMYEKYMELHLFCLEDTYAVNRIYYPANLDLTYQQLITLIFNNIKP